MTVFVPLFPKDLMRASVEWDRAKPDALAFCVHLSWSDGSVTIGDGATEANAFEAAMVRRANHQRRV